MKYTLEICCDHLESALAAQRGGAHRLELCAALATDGITPSAGLLRAVLQQVRIPVFVLVRPRPGNFVYTAPEIESMVWDIEHAREAGAAGIVSGALLNDGRIDMDACRPLIAAAGELPFTFHKAFDQTPDPFEALEMLIELGVDRVLTSGQAPSAAAGGSMLQELARRGRGRLRILCGGGVRAHNLQQLLAIPELEEFHSSALVDDGPARGDSDYPVVSSEMVQDMVRQLNRG